MFKKISLLSCATATLLASNGTNLIGTSTVSRAMGGTGVAFYSHATEALHKNVSLMGDIEKDEFQIDMTYFRADITSSVQDDNPLNFGPSNGAAISATSQNMPTTNFIPSMAYATRINDNTVFGVAMIGAAGMATQYEGEYAQRQLNSSMMLMKIIPGISYRQGNTTFGIAPVLGLGSMRLNYDEAYLDENGDYYGDGKKPQSQREGLFGTDAGGESLVPAFGWTAGIDIKVTPKLRIGANYNSSLKYTYKDVANFSQFGANGMVYMADEYMHSVTGSGLTNSNTGQELADQLIGVGLNPTLANAIGSLSSSIGGSDTVFEALEASNPNNLDDLTLEQPWELAFGLAYDISDKATVTADYRYIAWGLAEGYSYFGWENQHVFALGAEYKADGYALRFGYNYAESPIKQVAGETGSFLTNVQDHYVFDQALSMLNMVGFPAITTTHFTAGFGYEISENMDLDMAVMYAPESTHERSGSLLPLDADTTGLPADFTFFDYEYITKMQQFSLSAGLNYRF
ncbi:MAG TPA: hypothetical protein ENK65_01420 [Helicobacteraceae bacterium]|nr:hypothetical protein [Helicobacteraceae bacterium]